MKFVQIAAVCAITVWAGGLAAPADAQVPKHDAGRQLRQRFDPERLERPERERWQKPDQVVRQLGLKAGQVVADIGAGSGYFTRRLARAVAPGGRVYAVDIDPRMLRYLAQDVAVRGIENIVTVLAPEGDPMLAAHSVDLVFVCNTVHHFGDRPDYYRRLIRLLRPDGRLAVVEFVKRQLPVGPPPEHKITRAELIQEITAAGFRLLGEETLPYQNFLVFELDQSQLLRAELRRQVAHLISQGRSLEQIRNQVLVPARELAHPAGAIDVVYNDLTSLRLPDAPAGSPARALALVADRYHEPARIERGLQRAFAAVNVPLTITVDVRQLSPENLQKVQLLVMLRDGMNWPEGHDQAYVQWMSDEQQQAVADFVNAGGGFLALHNVTGIYPPGGLYYEVLAGQYHGHSPIEVFRVEVADPKHPVTRGVGPYRIHDEQHFPTFDDRRAHLLLRSRSKHGQYPAGWAYQYGQGRVGYLANGHTTEAIQHPMFQRLLRNAIGWCLRR